MLVYATCPLPNSKALFSKTVQQPIHTESSGIPLLTQSLEPLVQPFGAGHESPDQGDETEDEAVG